MVEGVQQGLVLVGTFLKIKSYRIPEMVNNVIVTTEIINYKSQMNAHAPDLLQRNLCYDENFVREGIDASWR